MASDAKPKNPPKRFLLLENADGEGEKTFFGSRKSRTIPRGELLAEIEGSGIGRYQLHTDASVQISKECSVAAIWNDDYQLLLGIPSPDSRYHVFYTAKLLTWGASLKNGDRARLSLYLPDAENKWGSAEVLIHYVGGHLNHPGTFFGVEISVRTCKLSCSYNNNYYYFNMQSCIIVCIGAAISWQRKF